MTKLFGDQSEQWFSNSSEHQNHPEIRLKPRSLGQPCAQQILLLSKGELSVCISSQLHVQKHLVDNLKSVTVGEFKLWELANSGDSTFQPSPAHHWRGPIRKFSDLENWQFTFLIRSQVSADPGATLWEPLRKSFQRALKWTRDSCPDISHHWHECWWSHRGMLPVDDSMSNQY